MPAKVRLDNLDLVPFAIKELVGVPTGSAPNVEVVRPAYGC
jgi:hypothetical protein